MQIANTLIFQIALILTTTTSLQNVAMVQQQVSLESNTFAGGQGTEADPYIIRNVTHLNNIRSFNTSYFRLESDINFAANEYADAQKGWEPILNFSGNFDGNGYILRNLFINRSEENNVGLFSNLNLPGKVKNLQLVSCNVFGGDNTGCLVGLNSNLYPHEERSLNYLSGGRITNVFVSGNITGQLSVGGVIGRNAGHMEKIYAKTNVTGKNFIGGIVGHLSTGLIIDSFADANVNGTNFIGGIAGLLDAGQILRSGSKGSVFGTNFSGGVSGGIIYNIVLFATIALEFKLMSMTSEYYGVIRFLYSETVVGYAIIAHIQDSYSSATVQGESSVGGLSGSVGTDGTSNQYLGNVNSSYSTGKVIGSDESTTGGLVGKLSEAGTVLNSYYNIETSRQFDNDNRGIPKSTSQLRAGLLTYPKWDSVNVWSVNPGFYPVLRLAGLVHIFNSGNLEFLEGKITNALSWFIIGDYYGNYSIQLNGIIVKSGVWENGVKLEYNLTTLPGGIHNVKISAFDSKNATSSILELTINISSDTQKPTINLITAIDNNIEYKQNLVKNLYFNISDSSGGGQVKLYTNGNLKEDTWVSDSYYMASVHFADIGGYNITLVAYDRNNNNQSISIMLNVTDTTSPQIIYGPSNISISLTSEYSTDTVWKIFEESQMVNVDIITPEGKQVRKTLTITEKESEFEFEYEINLIDLSLGEQNYNFTFYDQQGNSKSELVIIEVVDRSSPIITRNELESELLSENSIHSFIRWQITDSSFVNYTILSKNGGEDNSISNFWNNTERKLLSHEIPYNFTNFSSGTYNITIYTVDANGYTNKDSVSITIEPDKTVPNFYALDLQPQNFGVEIGEEFTLFWSISDNTISGSYVLYQNNVETDTCSGNWLNNRQNSSFVVRCRLSPTETGIYNYTLEVIDINGNSNSNSRIVEISRTGLDPASFWVLSSILILGFVGIVTAFLLPYYRKKWTFGKKVKGLEETIKVKIEQLQNYAVTITILAVVLPVLLNALFWIISAFFPEFQFPQLVILIYYSGLFSGGCIVLILGYKLKIWSLFGKTETEKKKTEKLETERLEAEKKKTEKLETERLEAEKKKTEKLETERLEAEKKKTEKLETEKLETEKLETERLEAEKLETEKLEAEKLETEKLETERLEAEKKKTEKKEVKKKKTKRKRVERKEAEKKETTKKKT